MQLTNLNTVFLGRNCIYYEEIDSTQSVIWRLYESGVENGTLIIAGRQTNRQRDSWKKMVYR